MSLLTTNEQATVAADVRAMIESSGATVRVLRPTKAGTGAFYGPHEPTETEIAVGALCEMHHLPPEEVSQEGHDTALHLLPETDIHEGDLVEVSGTRYRVTDLKSEDCFGTVTHIVVLLEREYTDHG